MEWFNTTEEDHTIMGRKPHFVDVPTIADACGVTIELDMYKFVGFHRPPGSEVVALIPVKVKF